MTIKQQGGIFGRNPTFNDVTSSKSVVDNITIDGNTISTTNTNGALVLEPNGSAPVTINATQPRVRLIDTDASGTPEAEISASGGDLILTADRDNEKSDTLIRFLIDGGEKWQINSTGNLVVSNSGNGIDFSATSGTGTSELFDDYEEGTWTPTLTTTGTGFGSITYDPLVSGYYTKVGNLVHIQGYMRTDGVTLGSASGTVQIGGLPYTSVANSSGKEDGFSAVSIGYGTSWAGEVPLSGIIGAASTTITLYYRLISTAAPSGTATSDVGTGSNNNQLRFTATYVAG